MADQRRRHLRRNALVLLGSFIGHLLAFWISFANFQFYPQPPPVDELPAVEVQVVPPPPLMPPPPPVPVIRQQAPQTPQPPSPPPTPVEQPPKPQPTPKPPQPTPAPSPAPTSPAPVSPQPTLTPAPKPAPAPTPLTPPVPAPQPGPAKAVPAASLQHQVQTATPSPHIVLHRNRNENANSQLAPSVNIPGAVFAQPTPPGGPPAGGAPAGGQPGAGGAPGGRPGFPGGVLPGFGSGLRGTLLGCANAEALHLTAEERAHCAQSFGEGTRESPQMNAIDASKRTVLDSEAASQAATQRYLNSTGAGSEATPAPGQPRVLTKPTQ